MANTSAFDREEWAIADIDSTNHALPASDLEVSEQDGSEAPGVLIFDRSGRVVSATPNAAGFLRDLGALDAQWREGQDMPLPVQAVLGALEQSLSPATEQERRRLPRLRTRARSGRWLVLHAAETAATDNRPSERVVIVAPAHEEDVAWFAVVGYELGSRTAEMVRSLVRGISTMQSAGGRLLATGLRLLRAPLRPDPIDHVLPHVH